MLEQKGTYSHAGIHKSLLGDTDYKNNKSTMWPARRSSSTFPLKALNRDDEHKSENLTCTLFVCLPSERS